MENNEKITIPFIVYESAMTRAERRERLQVVAITALAVLLVLTNIVWLIVWNHYDHLEDADDINAFDNYIDDDGDIYNGKDNSP